MTLADLYRKTLQRLGVLAVGEDPHADDTLLVADRYASLHELLLANDLTDWAVTDQPPDFAEIPLVAMLAYYCAGEFGRDSERYKIEGAIDLPGTEGGPSRAERQLRKQLSAKYISEPAESEYF